MSLFSDKYLTHALQECDEYQLSTGTGSPTDRQAAEEQLAGFASYFIPEAVEEIKRLRAALTPPAATPAAGGAGEAGHWTRNGHLLLLKEPAGTSPTGQPYTRMRMQIQVHAGYDMPAREDEALAAELVAFLNRAAAPGSPAAGEAAHALTQLANQLRAYASVVEFNKALGSKDVASGLLTAANMANANAQEAAYAPAAAPAPGGEAWIGVGERLPEIGWGLKLSSPVLVHGLGWPPRIRHYEPGAESWYDAAHGVDEPRHWYSHWQPLPAAPHA